MFLSNKLFSFNQIKAFKIFIFLIYSKKCILALVLNYFLAQTTQIILCNSKKNKNRKISSRPKSSGKIIICSHICW